MQRLRRQRVGPDAARGAVHDLPQAAGQQVRPHGAAQIAIGEDADQPAFGIDRAEAAEALFRHQQQRIVHRGIRRGERQFAAGMHQVPRPAQLGAQLSAGMEAAEIGRAEAAPGEQGHCQRVAQRHLHGGGGRGGQPHRAGFRRRRQDQGNVGRLSKRGLGAAGDGDQRDGEAAGIGDQVGQFRRFPGIGQRQYRIALHNHAEVAMRGFGRMDVERGGAGGGEGGGDFGGDMAGFAHAGDDDAAAGADQHINGGGKAAIERGGQGT